MENVRSATRLHPTQLLLTEQMHHSGEVLFRVIRDGHEGCQVSSSGSLPIDAVVVGDTVRLRTAIRRSATGQSVISIVAADNKTIASAVVGVSQ